MGRGGSGQQRWQRLTGQCVLFTEIGSLGHLPVGPGASDVQSLANAGGSVPLSSSESDCSAI
ncbi:hypothetical protein [Mycobacterium lepromatosis]|uniref:hypothetical protein n=1 Tax=Mycobacterium lepromatosis TaxID=480418 RepID=UPI0012E0404E|nr:hypothetical protein [Mycobacterium lepromatosis]